MFPLRWGNKQNPVWTGEGEFPDWDEPRAGSERYRSHSAKWHNPLYTRYSHHFCIIDTLLLFYVPSRLLGDYWPTNIKDLKLRKTQDLSMLVPVKIINITSRSMNIAILLMYEYLSVASNESFECWFFFSNSYTVLNFRYAKVMKNFSVDFGFFLHYNNSKIKLSFLQEKRIILLSNGCPSSGQQQRLGVLVITVIYKYMCVWGVQYLCSYCEE